MQARAANGAARIAGRGLAPALALGLGLGLGACGEAAADGAAGSAAPGAAVAPGPAAAAATLVWDRLRLQPPAGWERLPAVATAAAQAATGATSLAPTEIEAWGDPAGGCYAIAIESRGTANEGVAASADRLRDALAPLGVTAAALPAPVKDVIDAEVPVAAAGLTGTARIRLYRAPNGTPQGVALVCAGNEREPARCKTLCEALQLQLAPPVAP